MNRFLLPLIGFALLAVVLAIGIHRAPEKSAIQSPLIGKPAPVFALPNLADEQRIVRSQDLKGRPYLLNVWGTWCYACRAEHAMLLEIRRQRVVPLIGLNWKDESPAAREWLAKLGDPYEVVLVDREGRTAIDWGVYGAPETFLVDAAGIVTYKHVGPITQEVWTRQFLPHLRTKAVMP